jgi:hypothetical protein
VNRIGNRMYFEMRFFMLSHNARSVPSQIEINILWGSKSV